MNQLGRNAFDIPRLMPEQCCLCGVEAMSGWFDGMMENYVTFSVSCPECGCNFVVSIPDYCDQERHAEIETRTVRRWNKVHACR